MNEFSSGFIIVGGSNTVDSEVLDSLMALSVEFCDNVIALAEKNGVVITTKYLANDGKNNLLFNVKKRG